MQFRTKARAVDLLGKGQIADLPTAITELWKNGYDAYADNLTAEIYLTGYRGMQKPLFAVTDNGKGMSRREVFDKWLVLGTDSKSRAKLETEEGEETLWKKPRIKAGEKGIGRLSVAFLGSPMLMVTKKIGHPAQLLFFDWRILENYNLFLDDIALPVKELTVNENFDTVFNSLKDEFLTNFDKEFEIDGDNNKNDVWEDSQLSLKQEIINSVNSISLPKFIYDDVVSELLYADNTHGTKFLIFEPIDQIIDITSNDDDKLEDKEFVISSLSGFTNEFQDKRLGISTTIPIHTCDGKIYDFLNSEGNFFTSKDYDLADVVIDGEFDGKGTFNGTLVIYDEPIKYSYTNPRKKDSRTDYGSFPIKLGYSQGNQSESKLDENAFKKINDKVSSFGGLYLYRDNFRVLPYGRTDFDFLGFESRRAKRAATAYFSHRRMFGYIGLTRGNNQNLRDKSSREGLINNAAYRAFKDDLIAFFIDIASEFFNTYAKQSIFHDKKAQLKKQSEEIIKDKKRETQEKRNFSLALNSYPDKFEKYQQDYRKTLDELEKRTQAANVIYSEIEELLDKINTLDIEFNNLLPQIPKRYKPTDTQKDRLERYENKLIAFNETIKSESTALMKEVKAKLEVQALTTEFSKNYQKYHANLENFIDKSNHELENKLKNLKIDFSNRGNRILNDLKFEKEELASTINTKEQVISATNKIATKFEFLRNQIESELLPLVDHVKRLSFDIDEELLQGAYKAEYENIKNRWEQTRETAQLGVAVEIVDHEYNHLYSTINHTLDQLSKNEKLSNISDFTFLKSLIKQLEEKYDLLSPLYRISGVLVKDIKCSKIYEYLLKFFSNKLSSQNVKIELTKSFENHVVNIKEPVIHTVFINIINNALYWIRNSSEKTIKLDYWKDTEEILIMNSGQKIEEHRLERIFELFYSNRPNGRGIGLYLAKESLNENYFDVYATNNKEYNQLNGACFVIKPLN